MGRLENRIATGGRSLTISGVGSDRRSAVSAQRLRAPRCPVSESELERCPPEARDPSRSASLSYNTHHPTNVPRVGKGVRAMLRMRARHNFEVRELRELRELI